MFLGNFKSDLTQSDLFELLSASIDQARGFSEIESIIPWAESLLLDGRTFSFDGHEYQRDMLTETAPRQVFMKGAQVGCTSIVMLKTLHGLVTGRYPQGALYLFPSRGDVQDFSRGRFNPLLNDNDHISKFVQDTDAQQIKRVGRSMLYMRGARSTAKVQGMKRTSTALKSIPVDRLCLDESDEFEPAMIDLALERLSHSLVKEEVYLSTPTIPSFGVDRLYQESDQRVWMIKCNKCGGETCLELEFPACLEETKDGKVIRLCQRCRDNEIYPKNGRWVALKPDNKNLVGWRISQLNSIFVDPGKILRLYHNPPNGNLAEIMNSKLAAAHIAAENRLTISEVLDLCNPDHPIKAEDHGPCFLGCDVGTLLHVVIGKKHRHKGSQIVYVGAFPDWSTLNNLMKRFNVVRAVIDGMPEMRKSREFAKTHQGKAYCCFYNEHRKASIGWNDRDFTVSVNRTEALDLGHAEIINGSITLPAECETIHEFAKHLANVARVLQSDPETGLSRYVYVKTGDDHYRHAQCYEALARQNAPELLFPELV